MVLLGNLYRQGLGVPKDATKARAWYERVAAAGDTTAAKALQAVGRR